MPEFASEFASKFASEVFADLGDLVNSGVLVETVDKKPTASAFEGF